MKWSVSILLCCSVLSGQSAPKPAAPLPVALASVLAEVKAKSNVPVLLPSELPRPFAEEQFNVASTASQNEYNITLLYENLIFAALFEADAHPNFDPWGVPNVRKVKLSRGLIGYFREVGCGGSCAPANLWWIEGQVLYHIQLRLSPDMSDGEQQRKMITIANSAIFAGPR